MRTKVEIKNLSEEEKEVIRILSDGKPRGFNELFKELSRRNIIRGRERYWKTIKDMEKRGIIVRAIDVTHKKRKLIILSDIVNFVLDIARGISMVAEGYAIWFNADAKRLKMSKEEIINFHARLCKLLGEYTSRVLLLPFSSIGYISDPKLRNWAIEEIVRSYIAGMTKLSQTLNKYVPLKERLKLLQEQFKKTLEESKEMIEKTKELMKEKKVDKEELKKMRRKWWEINRRLDAPGGI